MSRILVIDDEQATLNMFSMFMSVYGHEVMTADNGEEGVDIFKKERPEIVMTDIKMPGMDGIEVLRRIKAINKDAEVIVITGHGDIDLAIKALNLDATDFLNKPVKREAVEKALKFAGERIQLASNRKREIELEDTDGCKIIRIRGSVTSQTEQPLHEYFASIGRHRQNSVFLFFDENSSINGAGISLLQNLIESSCKKGHQCKVAGLSENFRTVFDSLGISKHVIFYESEEQALKSIQ